MASEQFVDVSYRGLDLGKTAKLNEVGPTTAFIQVPKPMPVGSEITIDTDTGLALTAQVLRVHEQVAGVEHPGMRIVVTKLSDEAASWWEQLIDREDPVIPEAAVEAKAPVEPEPAAAEPVAAESEPEPVAAEAAEPEPEAAEPEPAEPEPAEPEPVAAESDAVPENLDEQVTEPHETKKKKKKKKPARTMIMNVDEIRAAVAEGGHEATFEGGADSAAPEPIDAGDTMRMGSGAVATTDKPADDGEKKKKKRKRKRKKR